MEYTSNYQLPVWAETDRILRTDFNGMTSAIDSALDGHDTQLTSLAGDLTAKGNCQIYTTSYTGTGTSGASGPTTLTFPASPVLVALSCINTAGLCVGRGSMFALERSFTIQNVTNWSEDGKTVSWYYDYPVDQLNQPGITYHVTALFIA